METKNLAIMFTDMKGYTSLSSSLSRTEIHYLLGTAQSIVSTLVKQYKGTVIKNLGDGHLATFDSPTNAVLCGVTIQRAVAKHNASFPERAFELRVAVGSGEVTVKDGDIFGDPVNIAARILAVVPPGEVYFTDSVFLSMNKNEAPSANVGPKVFKGVPEPINLYRVVTDTREAGKLRQFRLGLIAAVSNLNKEEGKKGKGNTRLLKYGLLIAAFLLVLGNTAPRLDTGLTRSVKENVQGAEATATVTPSPSPTPIPATATPSPTLSPTPSPTLTPAPTPYKNHGNNGNKDQD